MTGNDKPSSSMWVLELELYESGRNIDKHHLLIGIRIKTNDQLWISRHLQKSNKIETETILVLW